MRPEVVISSRKRQAPALLIAFSAALLAAASATADPSVTSKQAEAQRVLGQIQQLDSRLEKAIEAYDLANVELGRIRRDLKTNARELVVARANLRRAQGALAGRLVALYTSGEESSTLGVLLGATSLDDLVNRIDSVNRLSDQDARVVQQIVTFRGAVQRHKVLLSRARARQARIVSERAAHRASIEAQLTERQRLLSSIKGEIAHLQAVERSRQLALARQARARLATQRLSNNQQELGTGFGVSAASSEGATVVPPSRFSGVVGVAMGYLGVPYVWSGASPSGFDCSGFVMYVFAQVGVSLPHNAAAQFGYGVPVSQDQLQAGDLVFFEGLGHDGIYIGGGQFVHAPHTGDVVKISSMSEAWYAATYVGARRIL